MNDLEAAEIIERWLPKLEQQYGSISSVLEAVEHAAKRLREVQWQQIETAPKDGTEVILGWRVGDCTWIRVEGAKCGLGGWYAIGGSALASATHWMPLPEPPK